jgi:hypothetical protein
MRKRRIEHVLICVNVNTSVWLDACVYHGNNHFGRKKFSLETRLSSSSARYIGLLLGRFFGKLRFSFTSIGRFFCRLMTDIFSGRILCIAVPIESENHDRFAKISNFSLLKIYSKRLALLCQHRYQTCILTCIVVCLVKL